MHQNHIRNGQHILGHEQLNTTSTHPDVGYPYVYTQDSDPDPDLRFYVNVHVLIYVTFIEVEPKGCASDTYTVMWSAILVVNRRRTHSLDSDSVDHSLIRHT